MPAGVFLEVLEGPRVALVDACARLLAPILKLVQLIKALNLWRCLLKLVWPLLVARAAL